MIRPRRPGLFEHESGGPDCPQNARNRRRGYLIVPRGGGDRVRGAQPISHVQLGQGALGVGVDGLLADMQAQRHVGRREAPGEQAEHLALTGSEAGDAGLKRRVDSGHVGRLRGRPFS